MKFMQEEQQHKDEEERKVFEGGLLKYRIWYTLRLLSNFIASLLSISRLIQNQMTSIYMKMMLHIALSLSIFILSLSIGASNHKKVFFAVLPLFASSSS
jgi:hypothetical protein